MSSEFVLSVMPLFRKQSEKGKKRQAQQEFLASDNPEPTFDLSACEISKIPSGVFARCKFLLKEALLLHDNWLSSICGGDFEDLITLRVLDLHNNEIKVLPDGIGVLENLQVLNLENNKLKKLPNTLGNLRSLQTLNVKKNRIAEVPDAVCDLPCLRLLDISENSITSLPTRLCYIRTLETLTLDASIMKHPDKDICKKGTEDIMKYLCVECGLEYQPPSNFLLNVLEPPKPVVSSWSNHSLRAYQDETKIMESLEQYQKDKQIEEGKTLEKMLLEEQEVQALLETKMVSQKQDLVEAMAQDQDRIMAELIQLGEQKMVERKRMFGQLEEVEHDADDLLKRLLNMNEKAQKTEELLDALEKERVEKNAMLDIQWEEIQMLRRQEVLMAMEAMLKENEGIAQVIEDYSVDKDTMAKKMLEEEEMTSRGQVESVMYRLEVDNRFAMDMLAQQDELQRQAFEALLVAKDAASVRINSQITLIEAELLALTNVEQENKKAREDTEMNMLAEKRMALSAMLAQLLEQRDLRQGELRKRLVELDERREEGQTDYWLVQYQRLMDSKPAQLIDRENALEVEVVKIVRKSGAEDYLPLFARHRITIKTLMQLSEDELKQMGIHEMGLRKTLLRNIEEMKREEKLTVTKKVCEEQEEEQPAATPSAPPAVDAIRSRPSFQRMTSVIARGMNSECSICMERESEVIFLNCGHICCCVKCCGPLTQCPLCRTPISQKIKLTLRT